MGAEALAPLALSVRDPGRVSGRAARLRLLPARGVWCPVSEFCCRAAAGMPGYGDRADDSSCTWALRDVRGSGAGCRSELSSVAGDGRPARVRGLRRRSVPCVAAPERIARQRNSCRAEPGSVAGRRLRPSLRGFRLVRVGASRSCPARDVPRNEVRSNRGGAVPCQAPLSGGGWDCPVPAAASAVGCAHGCSGTKGAAAERVAVPGRVLLPGGGWSVAAQTDCWSGRYDGDAVAAVHSWCSQSAAVEAPATVF